MRRASISILVFNGLLFVQLLGAQAPDLMTAELKKETLEGFSRYVRATEERINKELSRPGAFLYLEGLPERRRMAVIESLQNGEIYITRLRARDPSRHEIDAPHGLIHHWLGVVFVSGATLPQTLNLVQDYNRHQDIYKPEVVRSRLISRNGDDFKIYYRLRKKKVITVTLNTEHAVHYTSVDATHVYSRSYSTSIAEVENADKPTEREKPLGYDSGFLWRINSYWRFEQRDGGVYVECEAISLTRDIPFGVSWLVKPFITDIPKESLQMTLSSTRSALHARLATAQKN